MALCHHSLIQWLLIEHLLFVVLGTGDIAVTRTACLHGVPEQRTVKPSDKGASNMIISEGTLWSAKETRMAM